MRSLVVQRSTGTAVSGGRHDFRSLVVQLSTRRPAGFLLSGSTALVLERAPAKKQTLEPKNRTDRFWCVGYLSPSKNPCSDMLMSVRIQPWITANKRTSYCAVAGKDSTTKSCNNAMERNLEYCMEWLENHRLEQKALSGIESQMASPES